MKHGLRSSLPLRNSIALPESQIRRKAEQAIIRACD
jgi:hypothetical protein